MLMKAAIFAEGKKKEKGEQNDGTISLLCCFPFWFGEDARRATSGHAADKGATVETVGHVMSSIAMGVLQTGLAGAKWRVVAKVMLFKTSFSGLQIPVVSCLLGGVVVKNI